MKITILTAGSRGDVQPYVALGAGLKKLGYEVRLPAPEVFRDLITGHGLEFVQTKSIDPQEFEKSLNMQKASKETNKLKFVAKMFREIKPLMTMVMNETWEACRGSDAIISTMALLGACDIAEKLNIPCIFTLLFPVHTTAAFPSPLTPNFFHSGLYNKMTHKLTEQLIWQPFRSVLSQWRRDILGMKPHSFKGPFPKIYGSGAPLVCGYSPSIIPKPADWPEFMHVTGNWFLDEPEGWQPPAELQAFLEAGPPPVYIGFGSMADKNSRRMTRIALEALEGSGQRGILSSGWGGLGGEKLPRTVINIGSVPHSWLFPRMRAIVHHGGAGTTAAAIRSGVPSIVVPFIADQPFWGRCVAQLGVGPKSVSYAKITGEKLAELITAAVTDKNIQEKARNLGKVIAAEKGIESAAEIIDKFFSQKRELPPFSEAEI